MQAVPVFPGLVPSYPPYRSLANSERSGRAFSTQSAIPYDPFRYSQGGFGKHNAVYTYEGSRWIRQIYGRWLEGGRKRFLCVLVSSPLI